MTNPAGEPTKFQAFHLFVEYRCYITPDYYLITYRDADLVRVLRNTEHRPGFVLLLVEVLFELLRGKRTALRERWALWNQEAEVDAERLGLECRAADRQVLEVDFVKARPKEHS